MCVYETIHHKNENIHAWYSATDLIFQYSSAARHESMPILSQNKS